MKHRLRQNKIALMLSFSGTVASSHYIYAAKCHLKKGNYSKFQFYVWNFKIWVIPAFKQNKKKEGKFLSWHQKSVQDAKIL